MARSGMLRTIVLPDGLHPATEQLVVDYAEELARKLRANEIKHGFGTDWASTLTEERCRRDMFEHMGKGDLRDVAIYCAFMWRRGWTLFGATIDTIRSGVA